MLNSFNDKENKSINEKKYISTIRILYIITHYKTNYSTLFKLFQKGMLLGVRRTRRLSCNRKKKEKRERIIVSSMYIVHIGSRVPLNKLSR